MKIGPVDFGVNVLGYLGGCAAAAIALSVLWKNGSDLRYESFYRDKIVRGLSDGIPDRQSEGVNACREFLKIEPNHIPARLALANTLALLNNHAEARTVYEETARLPAISPLQKAIALNGAGVSVFLGAAPDARTPALIAEAEKFFQAALDADKTFADPHANLALLQPFRNPQDWFTAAELHVNAALTSAIPPTAEALENTYRLSGLIYQHKKLAPLALSSFDAVQALKPAGARGSEELRLTTRLAGIIQPGINPELRKSQITELERSMATIDKSRHYLALTAIGLAYMEMKDETDWALQGYPLGVRALNRAIDANPKNRLAFDNLSALYDIRLAQLTRQLKNPVTGFNGVTPPLDSLKDGPKARRLQLVDKPVLAELRRVLKEQEEMWRKYVERSGAAEKEKTDARVMMIIAIRRQAYTMDVDELNIQTATLDRANAVSRDLDVHDPDSPEANFVRGMLLIDQKKYTDAHVRLLKAAEKGLKSAQLESILAALSGKPVMIGARPAEGQRWFGSRPLVSATLYSPNATDGFKSIEVTHNGEPAKSMALGTQVLYLPEAARLTDGKHSIQVSVVEAATQKKLDFPPLEFSIDRMPPSWKLSPDGGETDGSAVFTISLSDPTGVDLASIRVTYRSMDNAKNPTNREIVASGRYKVASANLGIKANATVPGDSFKVTAGVPLPAGAYVLELSVKDLSGNEMKSNKGFQVTK